VVARTLRALTRALLVTCAAVVALGLAASAVLTLSGTTAPTVPVVTLLAVGQAGALAGGAVVALALRRALRRDLGGERGAAGGDAGRGSAASASVARGAAARRLRVLARLTAAACVAAVAGWALADPGAAVPAALGALVAGQVTLLLGALAGGLVPPPAPGRPLPR
jgi:hypothetical protein